LTNVLNLEEKQGLRDRIVMGGMHSMAPRWAADARQERVDEAIIARVEPMMIAYSRADADRPALLAALREALAGNFTAADLLQPGKDGNAHPHPAAVTTPAQPTPRPSTWVPAEAPPVTPATPPLPADDMPDLLESRPATQDEPAEANVVDAPVQQEESRQQQPSQQQQPPKEQQSPKPAQPKAQQSQKQKQGKPHTPPQNPEDAPVLGATYVFEYEDAPPKPAKPQRHNRPQRTREDLAASPLILQGVGSGINEHLQKLGIETVEDLLWHLPFRYDDFTRLKKISELQEKEQATILANLWAVSEKSLGFKRSRIEGVLGDSTGTITAVWWNKWVKKDLHTGATLRLSGKVGLWMGKKTLENPVFEAADTEALATGRIAPVYPLTEGISQKKLRQLTNQVLEEFGGLIDDPLPDHLRQEYRLMDLATALQQVHFPDDEASKQAARRRLSFDEFLYIQIGVLQHRNELKGATAPALAIDEGLFKEYAASLPFPLTGAQKRVLDEVAADLQRNVPMTRLVQGDVGSGKTAVAAGAMYAAATNGMQSAMLAPTQILAEQHARALTRLLAGVAGPDGKPLEVGLLTGRVTGAERERMLEGLRDGTIPVVAGTTALIQETVEFANLGLVVVDEQHRFGVEQRGALRKQDALQPHMLVMSATPIPRSLALTLYGDLDLSILDEMPPGRKPVKTVIFRPFERERVYTFLKNEAAEGKQAFIVYPLVEESEVLLDVGAATEAYERLQEEVFPDLRLGLLHGQMKGSEKDAIMRAFADREFDILVSTSVIEVGIDIPNATVIMIEDAERFGLAQLHQFRGRVGRGDQRSFCVLVSRAEGDAANERLNILTQTNDGFVLAEKDLELRGPGDFFGTRQTGLPELQIALFSDVTTMQQARDAAEALLRDDPALTAHPAIAEGVSAFWRGHGDIS